MFPFETACEALEVTRSGYYAWLRRPQSERAERRVELAVKIKAIHEENRSVYGSPRVWRALKAQGESVCENTVARVMKDQEIRVRTKRTFVPRTTDPNHCQPVADNVLERQFTADLPNQKWAVDIPYIPTTLGWLYLTGVIELCPQQTVGW